MPMKIFTGEQIREIDRYTIEKEPVKSIDLMERASRKLFDWLTGRFGISRRIMIFSGPGNNGGDGLALGRMLADSGYSVEIHYVHFTDRVSGDWEINRLRLKQYKKCLFYSLEEASQFPALYPDDIIVDSIFGTGLTRPAEGISADVIRLINESNCLVLAVDIPSGLFCEDNSGNKGDTIIRADHTLSFEFPKLSFMFSENFIYTGEIQILPIGLHPQAIRAIDTPYHFLEARDILPLLKPRNKFDHKGIYGHGLLVAGSKGKAGAALLGARAALRTGIGLLTCHVPESCCSILQSEIPEAMVVSDDNHTMVTSVNSPDGYTALGAGPGLGLHDETQTAVFNLLKSSRIPMVIDADAINILSTNRDWLPLMQPGTILTPHPREFERLAGKTENSYRRLVLQKEFSRKNICNIVLKGANSSVTTPDGEIYFNSTGNPGMATAGSGDVLTGIILSLLAQGYKPSDAALAGTYIHGLAGDIAADKNGMESLIASDITENIGKAFLQINK